MNLLYKNK